MYLKEKQTSGKVDYQLKAELEEARKRVEEVEGEKRRLKADKEREIERLKRKVEEVTQENSTLKEQMKFIERERLEAKEKVRAAEKKDQAQSNALQTQPMASKAVFWADCPTSSFIGCMLEDDFSLMDLEAEQYNFDQLEYYKYYLALQEGNGDQLISEEQEPNTNKVAVGRCR